MDANRSNSNSPNKRNSFRSRTKLKDGLVSVEPTLKTATSYKMYLKQFPLGMAEDIVKIIQSFQPVHNSYLQNLGNLKLYKSQLAQQFEHNWAEFMDVLRIIIIKMIKRNEKLIEEKEVKVIQLLNINSQKQQQIQKLKDKLDNLEHLRQLQKAQLTIANNQVELANKQMSEIYDILQADMKKIFKYLTNVQASKQKQAKEESTKIYSTLENFNTLLNSMENEQKDTSKTLGTMREMIKAMARSTKTTTGTQVDESELQTKAANIFGGENSSPVKLQNYESLEAGGVNTLNKGAKFDHMMDKMKMKEKDHTHENYHPKKSIDKPWTLTPTLLTFLENMSKQNEAGRVLPWQHIKNLIRQIYEERIKSQNDMTCGMVGNAMLFDEYVVYFFLKKYKIRRLAQVKLLEFIISLKYYTKFWLKAEIFAMLMDVMRFIPIADQSDMYNYKSDSYSQNFFFQVYKRMINFNIITEEDGTEYVSTKMVKKLMKPILFFSDQISRSRLYVRLQKDIRIFDKVQCADFDYSMMMFMEEYYSVRRKMTSQISRYFTKINDRVSGYFSIDEIMDIFNEFSRIYTAGEQFPQKYPVESPLHIAKLYLYAITSGKNDFQMVSANFLQACQRYGFDSPYPFLHTCPKRSVKSGSVRPQSSRQVDQLPQNTEQQTDKKLSDAPEEEKKEKPNLNRYQLPPDIPQEKKVLNINQQRIDIASKLFSQHFSILKELKDYVDIFSQTLINQKDPQVLWQSFHQIKSVLHKGCSFLKYPLITRPEKSQVKPPINAEQK